MIQRKHDGLIDFGCAGDFEKKAKMVGNKCEIYSMPEMTAYRYNYYF